MQYGAFIGEVQYRAQFDSREAALSLSAATLTTLSERIQPGEAESLGAQLFEEIGRFLEEAVTEGAFEDIKDRLLDDGYDELFEIAEHKGSLA